MIELSISNLKAVRALPFSIFPCLVRVRICGSYTSALCLLLAVQMTAW